MKLAMTSKVNPDTKRALIHFKRPDAMTLETGQYHVYKLRTSPTNVDLRIYELAVPFFDNRSFEQWIKFQKNLDAVLKGQNVTSGPAKYAVVKTLLKGDTLTAFEAAETTNGTVTLANFEKCLHDVMKNVFPEKSVQTQKRYMFHNLRLRKGQTVKEWVSRVFKLNEYLLEFPKSNENPPQKLDDAELMDILEYGIPYSWRQEFAIHGFDLVEEGMKNSWNFALGLSLGSLPLRKRKQPMKQRLWRHDLKKTQKIFP